MIRTTGRARSKNVTSFFTFIAVLVSVPSAETVMEEAGGSVDVCATLGSSIISDIIVTLATSSTGATGKHNARNRFSQF